MRPPSRNHYFNLHARRQLLRLLTRSMYECRTLDAYIDNVRRTLHKLGYRAVPTAPTALYLWLREQGFINGNKQRKQPKGKG